MSPRTGRPPKENPRNINLNIRITKEEATKIKKCANKLNMTRTNTIMKGIDLVYQEKLKGESLMNITIIQNIKISNSKFPSSWMKTYESNIIPRVGDSIHESIWQSERDYKVINVTIDYNNYECCIQVEDYNREISEEEKETAENTAKQHGWKVSWQNC